MLFRLGNLGLGSGNHLRGFVICLLVGGSVSFLGLGTSLGDLGVRLLPVLLDLVAQVFCFDAGFAQEGVGLVLRVG